MNYRKAISLSTSFLFLFIIAIEYQNCGQAVDQAINPTGQGDDSLKVVDDLHQQKVAFTESLIIVKTDAGATPFYGACERKAQDLILTWKLVNTSSGEQMSSGTSECVRGGFNIAVPSLSNLQCDTDYQIQVLSVDGDEADLNLRKKCAPISQNFDRVMNIQAGSVNCYNEELRENSCENVCYFENKMYSREPVNMSNCSN